MTISQDQFAHVWMDLRHRLDRALDTLGQMAATARVQMDDPAGEARLIAKGNGLNEALGFWVTLNNRAQRDGDYAAAWRTFTDLVRGVYQRTEGDTTGLREGYALAVHYQRGYGPDLDATPLG